MLRKLSIQDLIPFDYAFEPPIAARMTDLGRALGSVGIGLAIQTVAPGHWSSRRHKHLFQEEILVVMGGYGTLHHGGERIAVAPGDAVLYLPHDPEPHAFENSGDEDLIIWAFGNRVPHEICVYPDQGVAFVEGLGRDIPIDAGRPSVWTESCRPHGISDMVEVSRDIRASQEALWRLWTTSHLMRRWWGICEGGELFECEMDVRLGGVLRYGMRPIGDATAPAERVVGIYTHVSAPNRLGFTWIWVGGSEIVDTHVNVAFEALPELTRVCVRHERQPSPRVAEIHRKGWSDMLSDLDRAATGGVP